MVEEVVVSETFVRFPRQGRVLSFKLKGRGIVMEGQGFGVI